MTDIAPQTASALLAGSIIRPFRLLAWMIAFTGCLGSVHAQEYTMSNGSATACTGVLLDSGGASGSGYGDNEDLTFTICPDVPGQGVALDFAVFDLSLVGPGPDQMEVYDGPDTSAPLIGTYTGTDLQGQVPFATPNNASGCLTFHFTSNAQGQGWFSASISCGTPCWPPTASAQAVGEVQPALVCADEVMTFDASASTAAAGQSIASYSWTFDDGTTGSGAQITHAFTEPGEYVVELIVTDDAGCINTQQMALQVLVGTEPSFVGTVSDQTICEGGTVDLGGMVTPTTWTGIPTIDLGGPVQLPDNIGTPFTSQLTFAGFPFGSTLASTTDILSICVSMEHSYMGDLVIEMICPSGQSITLHQQGGGTTFLGDANDTEPAGTAAIPGVCWDYCWSPTATLGTWQQSSQGGASPNVMPSSTPGFFSLVPGTYSSVQPFNNLIGCPLNGTWTFSITDMLLIDNGVICDWSVSFDPSFYSNVVSFTPVIGYTPDSMTWTGPGVFNTGDPIWSTVTPTEPGSYDYTYTVTDNFGCMYDTTITVTVTNAPVVEATSTPGTTCSDPWQLHADIIAFAPPAYCDYTLIINDSFGDGWNGGAHLDVVIDGVATTYSMPVGGNSQTITIDVLHGASISLVYTAGTIFNNENSFIFVNSSGVAIYASPNGPPSGTVWSGTADCGSAMGPMDYSWTPSAGVADPAAADTDTQITSPTEFVITVNIPGQPWCATTDTITVAPPSFLENDSVVVNALCHGGDGSVELLTTGSGGPWDYDWVDDQGNNVQNTTGSDGDTFTGPAGTYTAYIAEGSNGNGCLDTLTATITEPDTLVWVTVPGDTLICLTGTATLAALAQGGTGAIQLHWDQGLIGNGPHVVSPDTSTVYNVQAEDANGCLTSIITVEVDMNEPLSFIALDPDTECVGIPVVFTAEGVTGGDGQYFYDWGAGAQPIDSATFLLPVSGIVCLTLTDGCETPPVTSCVPLEILHTPPLVLTADTTFGCAPFSVRLNLQDTTEQATVLWDFGFGAPEQDSTEVVHLYPFGGNFTVGVEVTWPNGCITDTSVVNMIHVLTVPIADFTWSPDPATILEPTVHFQDLSQPNVVGWQWDFGEHGTSTAQDTSITFPNLVGDSYPVQLVVMNELGCTDTIRSVVDVLDDFLVFVPNAFTPNAEGPNETFFVSGNDISTEEYQLIVFDRWGEEIFNSTDRFEAWDGTSGGVLLPQGVYVWKLKVRSLSSTQKRTLFGHVTLLH